MSGPRSPTSSYTRSHDEALHVLAAGDGSRARLARPDRRREGDPARRADAAGVLHRRRDAREHAEYPLADVVFRAPVLHPPSVRIFDADGDFVFANPAAIKPGGEDPGVPGAEPVERVAAIIGADDAIGGFTPLVEWVAPQLQGAKQRDFALALGPFVTTPDEGAPPGVDWERLVAHAAENTAPLSRRSDRAMKVAVVGAGVMGCATAWALRERGAEVTVHEQFELDHDRGSSHGRTRIFRVAYPEVEWVRFAQDAYGGGLEGLDPDVLGLYGLIELVADPASPRRARSTSAACRTGCSTPTRRARSGRISRTAGRRCISPTRASCSPIARGTRSSRRPGSRSRRAGASSRPTSSTRTSSSSPPARGCATSSRTCP